MNGPFSKAMVDGATGPSRLDLALTSAATTAIAEAVIPLDKCPPNIRTRILDQRQLPDIPKLIDPWGR